MKISIVIQNLKCDGCGTTITNRLNTLEGVVNVLVYVENNRVSFEYTTEIVFEKVKKTLAKLGYPLVDEKNTFGQKSKSYISCAMGKIGK